MNIVTKYYPTRLIDNVNCYVIEHGQPCFKSTCAAHTRSKCDVCGRIKCEGEALIPIDDITPKNITLKII